MTLYKACFTACLFLLVPPLLSAQDINFSDRSLEAYKLALDLRPAEALTAAGQPETASDHYVVALAEVIDLVITEDKEKFIEYENRFEDRQEKKMKGSEADYQFLQAEMRLQWALVYFVFGHEIDAAAQLRQAYFIAADCRKRHPKYQPILKTMGVLEVMIGSVPEKYNWVLGLLGMEGSIQAGMNDLNTLKSSASPLAFEASLIQSLIQGFVFQDPALALQELTELQRTGQGHRLVLSLRAALAIKNSESEKALAMLEILTPSKLPDRALIYAYYLKGEVYLHKADYLNSISAYRWFLNNYKGENFGKDALYKIGLCYWLNGNVNDALTVFQEAKSKGNEASEADKYAARSLAEKELPNIKLSKIRYFTDGGYYKEASAVLKAIQADDTVTLRDRIEYRYRSARLAHKMNDIANAKILYMQTITRNGDENWYFAPNSCLQLGYIAVAENNNVQAKDYFMRALSYKKHEYKNSIDIKAKSALAQLKRK